MNKRYKGRREHLTEEERQRATDALGKCRDAMIVICTNSKIGGPLYQAASDINQRIIEMGAHLHGDRDYFLGNKRRATGDSSSSG